MDSFRYCVSKCKRAQLFNFFAPCTVRMSKRQIWRSQEDEALIAYVDKYKNLWPVGGNKLWWEAERMGITSHSWQSMKSRYNLLSSSPPSKPKKIKRDPSQAMLPFPSHTLHTSTFTSLNLHLLLHLLVRLCHLPFISTYTPLSTPTPTSTRPTTHITTHNIRL